MSEASDADSLSTLRHDLANLLMTVRGYAELMLLRGGLDPKLRRYPEQIVTSIDRATALLDEMRQAREASGFLAATPRSESISFPVPK